MPASENTWYDQKRMHLIFALSSAALLGTTIWAIWKDHAREWKPIQDKVVRIDLTTNQWRRQQFETDAAVAEHEAKATAYALAAAAPVDSAVVDSVAGSISNLDAKLGAFNEKARVSFDADYVKKSLVADLDKKAEAAKAAVTKAQESETAAKSAYEAWSTQLAAAKGKSNDNLDQAKRDRDAAEAALNAAERDRDGALAAAAAARKSVVDALAEAVKTLKDREDVALTNRKFKSADLDEARANVDLGVRDSFSAQRMGELQGKVDALAADLNRLGLIYQARNAARLEAQKTVAALTAPDEEAKKQMEATQADLKRLEKAYVSRNESYVVWGFGFIPLPGKKVLNWPILSAFNSPRKIENLWADGLTINNNFRDVRRFDRCTTCHQQMQKSLPGAPTDPAFIAAEEFDVVLAPPTPDQLAAAKAAPGEKASSVEQLEKLLGLRLAPVGLKNADDVTISYVRPESLAAKAETVGAATGRDPVDGKSLRSSMAAFAGDEGGPKSYEVKPGLAFADAIVAVQEGKVFDASVAANRILDVANEGQAVRLKIRRGLQNPFTTHPRLDLFVGDTSPHKMGTFGCTICHEGQGSATEFRFASHTPDSPEQMEIWRKKHGWFDNHHWIFPMTPHRFAESTCLKCHHNVTELEPSERFPDPPAPKVVKGYHLIRKYACFACHEINGYDGPARRVGPDMRLEPNYAAASLQLLHKARGLSAEGEKAAWLERVTNLATEVARLPENDSARRELRSALDNDGASKEPVASAEMHKLADLLKDQDSPGELRKTGPTLRFTSAKMDPTYLYDWTANPKNFRASTKMPRFFGLWAHLGEAHGDKPEALTEARGLDGSQRYEPIEIAGIVKYLQLESQPFEPIAKPKGIADDSVENKIARGKRLFETRGCLACHEHKDFPDTAAYREKDGIVQGPNLNGLAAKFDPKRNPQGKTWLYSWLKDPAKYSARTLMPNLYLDPIKDADGKLTDPADDLVEYLVSEANESWKPDPSAEASPSSEDLDTLVFSYLKQSFHDEAAERFLKSGIPADRRSELKEAERELLVSNEDYAAKKGIDADRKLKYIGKKTIAKFGCYACHDIPGFEDAKPIGTTLADWGRKDPSKIAFEHIDHYALHSHGSGHDHDAHGHGHDHDDAMGRSEPTAGPLSGFYAEALGHQHRAGFLFQKLREPRSYDYEKVENKPYNDRLRMPLFPFVDDDREAVITFVLGLVSEPPHEKYRYQPSERQKTILAGRKVLEKYNCGGCHMLDTERWDLAIAPDKVEAQNELVTFPFLAPEISAKRLAEGKKVDARGLVHATLSGLPALETKDALPQMETREGDPLEEEEKYGVRDLVTRFDLFEHAVLGDKVYRTGVQPMPVDNASITKRRASDGGFLAKYLAPKVIGYEREANAQAKGNEVWAWLPPPLVGQGAKVQTQWLHDFLLEPHPIRPAVFLRMPKFNMSPTEASQLVGYFAAKDNVAYPYAFDRRRQSAEVAKKESAYRKASGRTEGADEGLVRFNDAMKIVVSQDYCVKCHSVGDFVPAGSPRGQGPNLARVYERLRPDYVRNWIAHPTTILPYTAMPVNIKYDPAAEHHGGVKQELFHGTSEEQLDGLVDLLMNFDEYSRRRAPVAPLVPPPPAAPPAETSAATP